ncbi:adenine deaminase [Lutibaculum baratangense]|uniref:Adenine deaminase n=1 Tax=Lutibaculum baratangense AMV1 TaxID=631454 RepID=V4R006_9HYPH|nr:adenine deaminase [Lutibaculum baratangense]ESR25342.1 Adenine deaminase [Lutibaculum baratangense AMV1]
MSHREFLERAIAAGRGERPADLVVRNVDLLDVITGSLTRTDIAIVGDRIVGTHHAYEGETEIDGSGLFCAPGFIDTHLHVESSCVTPLEFDRCVLPRGITTAICDPHEIANVLGLQGIRYFLDCAGAMAMDLRVNLSSCVPATDFETAGAELSADDLAPLMDHKKVIGLAEFMNFPGILHRAPGVMDKLDAFFGRHIDGHCPLLSGRDLCGYVAAGIRTEHEATTAQEAREKLAKGLRVLIREGSVSKDLHALAGILDENTSSFVALCTDDRNPLDIDEEGHLDHMIRTLIALGRPRHHVYRAASWSGAQAFGLRDRGLVAPGQRADMVLLDDLDACSVRQVIAGGRIVNDELFAARPHVEPVGLTSMKAKRVTGADFQVKAFSGETPVIGVVPGRIITERLHMTLPQADGLAQVDLDQDAVKVAVVERHGRSGSIGVGFVNGFGLKRGAIASSVGHDSHNVTVVGADDGDMALAVNRLGEIGGGFVVVEGGEVKGEIALPVAGLMSLEPFETVRDTLIPLRRVAKDLGCTLAEPFLQVAFLPLPVIPHLKITDRGLFDVDAFDFVRQEAAE